jgi:hypothetical protein
VSLVIVLVMAAGAWAQCAEGDVLWVSEAVNANVGTAAGGGRTFARCATSTVAGAGYNNPAMPFGAQAALDCGCPGATIRYLAGAGNYGSSTASWNDRIDATKVLIIQGSGVSDAGMLRIEGWVNTTTQCTSFQQAGCPIDLDFAGGSSHGFSATGSIQLYTSMMGIHVQNAAQNCINTGSANPAALAVVEMSGCGAFGVTQGTNDSANLYLYAHNNLNGANIRGVSMMMETHDNAQGGVQAGSADGLWLERALAYDNGTSGYSPASQADTGLFVTMTRNGGAGLGGGVGSKTFNGYMNLLSQDNVRFGLESYGTELGIWGCLFVAANGLGTFDNPTVPRTTQTNVPNNDTSIATFAGPLNFEASGLNKCLYGWPGSTTVMRSCPGAVPVCEGGAGIFIQTVR